MSVYRDCVLFDRKCIDCGECDWCDLNPEKICDNCKECIKLDSDYLAIQIDGYETSEEAIGDEE